jgi:ectoine hydroxylase-related dioxygenase (phytanoyl-CoA dioxygenase family)
VCAHTPSWTEDDPLVRRVLERAVTEVRRDGVSVIEDVLEPATVAVLAPRVRAMAVADFEARMADAEARAAAGETLVDVWPQESGVVHLCLDPGDDRFQRLAAHPVARALAAELLGPSFEVAGLELRVPLPGFGHQGLHQDIESPPDPARWRPLRITWVLSPFTVETGTFRFIPGSHLTGPPRETGIGMPPHPDEVRVVAPAGSILLKSAHVWHSGTFNASRELRLSVDVDYRAG